MREPWERTDWEIGGVWEAVNWDATVWVTEGQEAEDGENSQAVESCEVDNPNTIGLSSVDQTSKDWDQTNQGAMDDVVLGDGIGYIETRFSEV